MDKKLTLDQFLMGRDKAHPIDDDMRTSSLHLLSRVNELLEHFYKKEKDNRVITSGYRPAAVNASVGGAKKSHHQACRAVDISDADRKLARFCLDNLDLLDDLGLWMEDPRWTNTWVHFQLVSPGSGKRIFVPSSAQATDPSFWDGKYDTKYDKKS
jgi:hypothetical protein